MNSNFVVLKSACIRPLVNLYLLKSFSTKLNILHRTMNWFCPYNGFFTYFIKKLEIYIYAHTCLIKGHPNVGMIVIIIGKVYHRNRSSQLPLKTITQDLNMYSKVLVVLYTWSSIRGGNAMLRLTWVLRPFWYDFLNWEVNWGTLFDRIIKKNLMQPDYLTNVNLGLFIYLCSW